MTTSRNRTAGMLFLLLVLAGTLAVALPTLMQASGTMNIYAEAEPAVAHWLAGKQTKLPAELPISTHATQKHGDERMSPARIQRLLMEGRCASSRKWCADSGVELYLCADPISGIIGGLFVMGDQILTGFQSTDWYWLNEVSKQRWGACDGRYYDHP